MGVFRLVLAHPARPDAPAPGARAISSSSHNCEPDTPQCSSMYWKC